MQVIFLFFILVLLSGCTPVEKKEAVQGIQVEYEEDVNFDSVSRVYIYKCEMVETVQDMKYNEHIAVMSSGILKCDGLDVYYTDLDGIRQCNLQKGYELVPENIESVDIKYNKKNPEEIKSYLEEYLNNEIIVYDLKEKKCIVNSYELIYIVKNAQEECYLIPVAQLDIKGYGYVYIEVNSGCIIW